MHILRPMFAWDRDGALDFAAARGFGAVIASGDTGPISSHVPFNIHRKSDAVTLQFHLTARNRLPMRQCRHTRICSELSQCWLGIG